MTQRLVTLRTEAELALWEKAYLAALRADSTCPCARADKFIEGHRKTAERLRMLTGHEDKGTKPGPRIVLAAEIPALLEAGKRVNDNSGWTWTVRNRICYFLRPGANWQEVDRHHNWKEPSTWSAAYYVVQD